MSNINSANNLQHKNIVIGLTGSIAIYKSIWLIRQLRKLGANVRVVLSQSAQEFITPLTLQAVSGNAVARDLFDEQHELAMGHIELAKWANAMVIAPSSANFIARLNLGLADDLLSTICLATTAPILIAPAMNKVMFEQNVIQNHLANLQNRGVACVLGKTGKQACGDVGMGRMAEPEEILLAISELFQEQDCHGLSVAITAGATREPIDPVRFITNHSSGKMGFALAEQFARRGAKVTLIASNVNIATPTVTHNPIERVNAVTAQELLEASLKLASQQQIFIACSAVADFRPKEIVSHKIKKVAGEETMILELVKNPDIVATVANLQENRPFVVGFCAETQNLAEYAQKKLVGKNLDLIFANDVSNNQGFNKDHNAIQAFWQENSSFHSQSFPLMTKHALSHELINLILQRLPTK